MFLRSLTILNRLSLSCAGLLVALAAPSHAARNSAGAPPAVNCPFDKATSQNSAARVPGTEQLGRALTLLEQQRFAAAYAGFKSALHQGLSDPLERAHAYKSIGLIMCRFQSDNACEKNLLYALGSSVDFRLEANELAAPRVKPSYEKALIQFQSLCGPRPVRTDVATDSRLVPIIVAAPVAASTRSSRAKPAAATALLAKLPSDSKSPRNSKVATVMLQITPWAGVAVDGGQEIISPPTKSIQVQPGEREIVIRNGSGEPVIVEANFQSGQTWVLHHGF